MPDPNQVQGGTYVRADELFTSPQQTTIAEDVRREIVQEREEAVLDTTVVREQEDWSALANLMVGGEGR